jgi:hypothetical protein
MRNLFTLISLIFINTCLLSQTINDSASIGANYANQTFYSLANSTVLSIDNSDWDLAFNTENREVSIFVNSKKDVKLYLASNDTLKWATLDTTNKTTKQFHNSDSSWSFGAFNRETPIGSFDYGWGNYNSSTHEVYGSKIYFINYGPNLWKKLMISKHDINYTYYFRYANLDGSNEVSATINKTLYNKKSFIYYSLSTNSILNREPDMLTYDLIFHQYEEEIPSYYKVTGVQLNKGVKAKKVYPVNDVNTITPSGVVLTKNITAIGRDWKYFDVNLSKYSIQDSTVYFVQDAMGSKIWKVIFTGFGGASTGKMYFSKTAFASGINDNNGVISLGLYPNPSSTSTTVNLFCNKAQEINISVKDITGREIMHNDYSAENGFNDYTINTLNFNNGTYFLQINSNEGMVTQKFVVNK